MSEVMTSEAIIEAEWLLKGYWTKPRFAFQTANGAWSDVDVLSYMPATKHLVISESKVRGERNRIDAYTKNTKKSFAEFDKVSGKANYLSFLEHIPALCEGNVIFRDKTLTEMVESITIQLVCNYVVTSDVREKVENELKKMIPVGLPCANFQLDSTIDVFARVIKAEKNSGQNKRYGNPVLDIAREINRYFFPSICGAGRVQDELGKQVRKEAVAEFLKAIGVG